MRKGDFSFDTPLLPADNTRVFELPVFYNRNDRMFLRAFTPRPVFHVIIGGERMNYSGMSRAVLGLVMCFLMLGGNSRIETEPLH